ncbi:SDR family oxidoreductase [Sphingobium phenoxybenzoativorans]|uniref:SDR family oxidoreductase n=1 Tax=Sphingobium phenoxybenzoativorans TaxID=1592790 RepID=A0A975Q0L6_9SPHN|nr:SDR family oxidoreductase [Sphingobium phenoxybenzoativorans]QUT04528.1 SDR family oxidoreductase [Sphingobium phenoxybenzoativorans]
MGRLAGRNVVITGAAGGIGLATAKLFLAEGANLLLVDREPIERPDLPDATDSRWITVQADLSIMSELDKITDAARKAWDRIDVYFACAGLIKIAPLGGITEEVYDRHMAVNLKAVVFGVQNILPMMNEGASIVLMSSCMADMGAPGYSPYGATKAAVRSLARNWSLDLSDRKIRVNALMPGGIQTPLLQDSLPADNTEVVESLLPRIPMHRIGDPDEVAQAALFLASTASSYMTGAGLAIDGGIGQV